MFYFFSIIVNIGLYIMFYVFIFFLIKFVNALQNRSIKLGFKKNVVIVDKNNTNTNSDPKRNRIVYRDITKEELKKFNTENIDEFKDYLYDIFLRFEQAYNNLDYSTMEFLSTKQLYQNYHTGISLDLKLGKKRIIENIEKKEVVLYEIDSTVAKQSASIMIEISYINYVVDNHGDIVSGYRNTPITEKFEVEFRKYFESHDTVKCKNCGAVVTGNRCEFCRSKIQFEEFRISSIRKIVEK